MIRRFIVAATLAVLSTTAFAADLLNYGAEPVMAPVPAFDSTGFHVGISGGYGFNADDPSYSYTDVPSFIVPLLPTSIDLSGDGGLIGGSAGFDKQINWVVLGVEGDFSGTDFGGNATFLNPPSPAIGFPPLKFSTSYNVDCWFRRRNQDGLDRRWRCRTRAHRSYHCEGGSPILRSGSCVTQCDATRQS